MSAYNSKTFYGLQIEIKHQMKTKRISINSDIYSYYIFEAVRGQMRPMVCGRLPWNVLDFWLETFWIVSRLVLFEARRVPWFAGGYHGTFWIFSLKPSVLFPVWYCLRPGVSHGLQVLPWNVLDLASFR